MRALILISEYFRHRHKLSFRHHHPRSGIAGFLVVAGVHAVAGVHLSMLTILLLVMFLLLLILLASFIMSMTE